MHSSDTGVVGALALVILVRACVAVELSRRIVGSRPHKPILLLQVYHAHGGLSARKTRQARPEGISARRLYSHVDVVSAQACGGNLLADTVAAYGVVVRAVLGTAEPCLAYKHGK